MYVSASTLKVLPVVEEFIKRRDDFLKNLTAEKNLKTYFVNSNLAILVLSAIYGATMGIYGGGLQILYSAIKVPMLLLVSLYITVPSYYVLYSLLGGKRTFGQTVMLLLLGFTIMSTVLIAFVPVNLFFILTSPRSYESHNFTTLLNIAIFALGGFFALTYFVKGAETLYRGSSENWKPAFILGSIILMFVGTQLTWVLRPFFNYYELFIRPVEGNFYTAVSDLLMRTTGLIGTMIVAILAALLVGWLFLSVFIPTKKEQTTTTQRERAPKEQEEVKTCSQCGRELPSDAKFCVYCGTTIE
jgi:hypothetical protein